MPGKGPVTHPKDLVYLYDGSWPGFFCCAYESVYQKEFPYAIYSYAEAEPSLFPQKAVETDSALANRVLSSIPQKISPRALELLQNCFFSCLENKEIAMLRFLLLGYREGSAAPWLFGHPDVSPLLGAEKHLMGETHLLKGFVRFSDHGGHLVATITPKNFVLPFLVEHFVSRYAQEDFLIYDKTHKAALLYENHRHQILPLEALSPPEADESEQSYRALWKQFYNTVAIEARTNPRCRMTHMPKRYWENMLEVQDLL